MKIASKVIVFDRNNDILVLTRSNTHPRYPLHADFPGGLVEKDEDVVVAAMRELFEETKIDVPLSNIKEVHRELYQDNWIYVVCQTRIDAIRPKVTLSWEHSGYVWKTKTELVSETLPYEVDSYYRMALTWLRQLPE